MDVNPTFKREVLDILVKKYDIDYCYQCGYCNERCPIHRRVGSKFNPRDIILMSAFGYLNAILNLDPIFIWGCTDCETCDEVCPANIHITEIISILKNKTILNGTAPSYYASIGISLLKSGMVIPSQPAIEKRREKLGLGPSPPTGVDEVQYILHNTKWNSIIKKMQSINKEGQI